MKKKNLAVTASGALVAAAISGMMVGSAYADSFGSQGISKATSSLPGIHAGMDRVFGEGGHDCKGKNDCKGHGGCKTGDNGCKGKNSCKGKGGCKSDHAHE